MNAVIRCMVLEDQRPAQKILSQYISDTPQLSLVSICSTAVEASNVLKNERTDLIFLDLHLPKLSGFNFLRSLVTPPRIIVTTADGAHALEGFDLNVVDYLLKPFSFHRFLQAVNKVQSMSHENDVQGFHASSLPLEHLFFKAHGEIHRVGLDEIMFIKSDGDYVEAYLQSKKVHFSQKLKQLEETLPSDRFVRIHKSYIVSVRFIDRISGYDIHIGGTTIPLGRNYKEQLLKRISL